MTNTPENKSRPAMQKRETRKEDCRSLIYYTFASDSARAGQLAAENSTTDKSKKAAANAEDSK